MHSIALLLVLPHTDIIYQRSKKAPKAPVSSVFILNKKVCYEPAASIEMTTNKPGIRLSSRQCIS